MFAALAGPAVALQPGTATVPGRLLRAGTQDYRQRLRELRAGDTLELEAGEYLRGLPLHELEGTAAQPIVIAGPRPPEQATFIGRSGAHTVSLLDCSHVQVRDLVLDGRGAPVDAVRAEGHARWVHHVTLERLRILNHGASQQHSGISSKCPAWGWTVRENTIIGAGTGMYFGDSDGSDPFFESVIEGNRILDPLGYGIQIKHQIGRPDAPAGITGDVGTTVICRNTIIKGRVAPAAELARPSLLVGHWPIVGPGARDRYLIHGNFLFDNPSEALFQGEGNCALYNNLLVNPRGEGIRIQPHNDRPREVVVFGNTIVAAALGVVFIGGEPGYLRLLEHNLILGSPPLRSEISGDNLTGTYEAARSTFVRFRPDFTQLDLTPRDRLPSPKLPIDEQWLELQGARHDYLGRARRAARYGACERTGDGSSRPCR